MIGINYYDCEKIHIFFIHFSLYCSLIACSTNPTSLQELSKELFSEYLYEVDTDRNKSSTQLIVIKINKENFSINDYNEIKNKLLSGKWDFVDSYDNYYNFVKLIIIL